jgi:hypothetical protein
VTAADLVAHPERIADVEPRAVPAILAQLTSVAAALAARMPAPDGHHEDDGAVADRDRLLTAKEAAAILQVSPDFLRRSPHARPLRVRVGRELRFSSHALQAFIARRTGRE